MQCRPATLIRDVLAFFLEYRLGHSPNTEELKKNCLVLSTKMDERLPDDWTLKKCCITTKTTVESMCLSGNCQIVFDLLIVRKRKRVSQVATSISKGENTVVETPPSLPQATVTLKATTKKSTSSTEAKQTYE